MLSALVVGITVRPASLASIRLNFHEMRMRISNSHSSYPINRDDPVRHSGLQSRSTATRFSHSGVLRRQGLLVSFDLAFVSIVLGDQRF